MSTTDDKASSATPEAPHETSPSRRSPKRWQITAGVIAAVLACAGAGFWIWHEQPSFCSAFCHYPMNSYVETYNEEAGVEGVDKWGNTVANTNSMLAVVHREAGETCLSCHVPTLTEQISEGVNWLAGNYVYPLYETDLDQLTEASGMGNDEFCFGSGCHTDSQGNAITNRDELIEATSDLDFNPHVAQHGERECSDCHKAHRASVMYCSSCHDEAEVPEGWITPDEESQLIVQ